MRDRPVTGTLVGRRFDGLLVGWLAVLIWVLAVAASAAGVALPFDISVEVFWIGAVISSAHFGLSYHLAYGAGTAIARQRPVPLVIAPAALAVGLAAVAAVSSAGGTAGVDAVIRLSLTTVYLFTTWHYIKQVYGIGRLGAAFAGAKLTNREVNVLRYGLYPLAALGGAKVLIVGANYGFGGYLVGYGILPHWVMAALVVSVVVGGAAIAVVLAGLWRRGHFPQLLVAGYLAAFLWLATPVPFGLALLLLAPLHALQYMAIGHRAELALAGSRGEPMTVGGWLNVMVAVTAIGLLMSRWLPELLDGFLGGPGRPLMFLALTFVFLNLHHYLIDATIWRSSGELVRAIARKPSPAEAAPQPV